MILIKAKTNCTKFLNIMSFLWGVHFVVHLYNYFKSQMMTSPFDCNSDWTLDIIRCLQLNNPRYSFRICFQFREQRGMQVLGLALSDMANTETSLCFTSTCRWNQKQHLNVADICNTKTMNGAKNLTTPMKILNS